MKKCKYCNEDIKTTDVRVIFCNSTCGYRFRRGISLNDTNLNKECIYCNKNFIAKRSSNKYCSHNCCNNHKLNRNSNNINGSTKNCPTCKQSFLSKGPTHIYCRFECNINKKIKGILRNRLNSAIKNNQKAGSAVSDLGCSIEEFKIYLEKQFFPNPRTGEAMRWDNHTTNGWHIDHIDPLDNFDLENREELLIVCHYSNMQPLWAKENLEKSNKYISDIIEESIVN